MKLILALIFSLIPYTVAAQNAATYFEKIRGNTAALTTFMAQMPKGGDLHHHYSGSVYSETFLDYVVEKDFAVNRTTLEIAPARSSRDAWTTFSVLKTEGSLDKYKQRLIQQWSVKDYNHVDYPADKLFFESFEKFRHATAGTLDRGLLEIKNRALKENVSYIETMFGLVPCDVNVSDLREFNPVLRQYQTTRNEQKTMHLLDSLYKAITDRDVKKCAIDFNENVVAKLHNDLKIDDDQFTMRYQNFVVRVMDPLDVFKSLIVACESDQQSNLIVGVNIVAPENNETAMKDYWLHMMMFKYCHSKYPTVTYALHAGELTMGMVKPEELTWHINAAVRIAGARRIGHGVAMPYETNAYDLLRYMSKNKIAVELNLSSNEFILNVKDDKHPILLYKEFGVPIVISSDDAGILRTSLTEQYVLLAKRYKAISYADIKRYVYNSLIYNFIDQPAIKQKIIKNVDARFRVFERSFPQK